MTVTFEKGIIKAFMNDIDFVALVMKQWAQLPEDQIQSELAMIEEWQVSDPVLEKRGFAIANVGRTKVVTLLKVGIVEWKVKELNSEQMEEFVISLQENLE